MDFVTGFISLFYLTAIVSLCAGEDCTNMDTKSCSCKTSKYTIDLSPLKSGGNPRFSVTGGEYQYDYMPCEALNEDCGGPGAAVCQKSKTGTGEYNAGSADSAEFSGDADVGTLQLKYTADPRTSVISLQCTCDVGEFSFKNEDPTNQYNFVLKTRNACGSKSPPCGPSDTGHKRLSTGSVLLILFFVFLAIYFIAGILFLKFVRGAQGKEMVPNYEFWTALPGLIKDGMLFTCRGCKKDSSYSQI